MYLFKAGADPVVIERTGAKGGGGLSPYFGNY